MCDRSTFHFGTVTAEGLYQPVLFLMAGNKLVTALPHDLKYLLHRKEPCHRILWQLFECSSAVKKACPFWDLTQRITEKNGIHIML